VHLVLAEGVGVEKNAAWRAATLAAIKDSDDMKTKVTELLTSYCAVQCARW